MDVRKYGSRRAAGSQAAFVPAVNGEPAWSGGLAESRGNYCGLAKAAGNCAMIPSLNTSAM
jgi:hypothetical protein